MWDFSTTYRNEDNDLITVSVFSLLEFKGKHDSTKTFPLVLIAKVDSMEDANVAKKKLLNITDNLITVFFNSCWFLQHLNQRSVFQEQAQLKLLLSF